MMAVIITSSNLSIYLISCSCAELPITSTVCSLSVMVKQLRDFFATTCTVLKVIPLCGTWAPSSGTEESLN